MSEEQRAAIHQLLRDAPFDLGGAVAIQRPRLEEMLTAHPLPDDVRTSTGELGGVPVVFVDLAGVDAAGVLFHLHGGGFALGSAMGSVELASGLARRTGLSVVTVDYRLAPEHPYPAAVDDVVNAYRALLAREGGSTNVVVSGESAGGNLALELLLALRAEGLAQPAAAVLLSPMTDLTVSGESYRTKAAADPNITATAIRTRVGDYLGGTGVDPADPRVSPIFADLTGLPPLLVQAGSNEVLLDDATRLAVRAAADNVAVILDVVPGVPHVFQAFAATLDEGAAALDRAGRFIGSHLASATS
ncbi:alpha/beta hydrolase [Dactylosporangium vinaceum]|uniref:Alpha/beta hydrolase n=1 Tax=Dactylosporangium vinaceum TaxID=53362 RepID=A0ABV5MQX3_9ACTN|nr:alpha/beta hydrolase [Dactylosporangium vinaceum]UAB93848.1 alpha/beta hydrolase [Dactylosporangium vinaceum]